MPSPRPKNVHGQVVDAIGARIVSGEFAEGAQLPTEPQLAESLGASRLLIREAMKVLEAKGLVAIRPRTGTRVCPRHEWNLFDAAVLGWHSVTVTDPQLVDNLMELRRTIEPVAAKLAAERRSAEDVKVLQATFSAMQDAVSHAAYLEADLAFHSAVLQACGNPFIRQLSGALSEVLKASFHASSDPWGPDARALALHKALLDAIVARTPAAADEAVQALIARAQQRIRKGRRSV
ncbi:MAG: FadR/GntR family transcriptional regulator [Rubrivivax sp.]